MSVVRLELTIPDDAEARRIADQLDRRYVHRGTDDLPAWTSASVMLCDDDGTPLAGERLRLYARGEIPAGAATIGMIGERETLT